MATIKQRINKVTGVNQRRTANKGLAARGKQSGFATSSQKRADLRSAFGGAG